MVKAHCQHISHQGFKLNLLCRLAFDQLNLNKYNLEIYSLLKSCYLKKHAGITAAEIVETGRAIMRQSGFGKECLHFT